MLIREHMSSTKWDQKANGGLLTQCLSARDFYEPLGVWHRVLSCSWHLSAACLGFS